MKKIIDYLVMRTPEARLAATDAGGVTPEPGIPKLRITLSIIGILIGIIASFYVTGIKPRTTDEQKGSTATTNTQSNVAVSGSTNTSITNAAGAQTGAATPQNPQITNDFSWKRFRAVGLIAIVICGLTYQGLYFALRLYAREPAFLILFVSFQYGYFWQSMVEGGRAVLTNI